MFNDNKLIAFLDKLVNLFLLNILFVLTSLPIITIGASLTALNSVNLKMVQNEESYITSYYFKSFKRNFRVATLGFLPLLAFSVLMTLNIAFTSSSSSMLLILINVTSLFFLFIAGICALYFFAIIARFHFSVKQAYLHIPQMLTRNPIYFFTLILPLIPIVFLAFYSIYTALLVASFFILIGSSTLSYVHCFTFRKIFKSYEI